MSTYLWGLIWTTLFYIIDHKRNIIIYVILSIIEILFTIFWKGKVRDIQYGNNKN
jgi:hypothetical protein